MSKKARAAELSKQNSSIKFTTGSVISSDGTRIGYRQLGQGPGIVFVHGAMESAHSHIQLANELADAFTVFLLDRRGRGPSGSYSNDYSIRKDVEDMEALLYETGARKIFGVSSGAIICLQTALKLPSIVQKVAIYEPPLPVKGSISMDFLPRFRQELARGDIASALVTGMKGAQMGPPIFNAMPRWFLKLITKLMLASEDKKAMENDVTFRMLAPTLYYDFQMVEEMSNSIESFNELAADVLLLGGSKSPTYLKIALDALEKNLPRSQRIVFSGLGHGGSGNVNQGGKPVLVAQELKRFFGDRN